jgi:hypothetical protein
MCRCNIDVMADDENPEIAAALAKLAGQDAAAADDAQSALEWIAGEQGLALITQERIQTQHLPPAKPQLRTCTGDHPAC